MNTTTTPGVSRSSVTLVLDLDARVLATRRYPSVADSSVREEPQRRVLVLAHRGMPGPRRRENTVRAVEAALNAGADGVEVDVRLTADGVLVCSHDAVIRTPSGTDLAVAETSASRLRSTAPGEDLRLATLHEVVAAAAARHPRRGRRRTVRLVVEAKPAPDHAARLRTAAALVTTLGSVRSATLDVTVSSFDGDLLALVRNWLPRRAQVRTALLGPEAEPAHSVVQRAASAGHQEAHLNVAALRHAPHAIALAHRLGVSVTVWTVNGNDDLRWLARWGVDAVITDSVVAAGAGVADPDESGPVEVASGAAC